ncbi:transmembrane protein 236-like [Phyllopteryx taeniolatus]|uniref:transmembrane protein 236-like n=1 Tax=Phyllopteryx taeniolatus TaxID=161469 RepID=UPI002AD2A185|nr:transmembrane protein 236-like [Phyllopteryx taeniolatus]
MGSGRTLKLVVCEALQFAGLCVPLFVIMQRFAAIVAKVQGEGGTGGAYWLIVASSVAYVTSATLLVWVPLKYMVFAKKRFLVGRKKWRPVALVFVILSTMPCFAFLIASSEVQIRNKLRHDTFAELPVSLILFSLISMDVVERIRHCRLTGQDNVLERDPDIPSSVLTHVEQVTPIAPTVQGSGMTGPGRAGPSLPPGQVVGSPAVPVGATGQRGGDRTHNGSSRRPETNGTIPGIPDNARRAVRIPESSPHVAQAHSGPLRFLCASDARADVFVDGFMFWMDTAEMTRVAFHPLVCYSSWVSPIYVFCCLSCLRVVVVPHDPLLSSLGVVLQDLPFLFVRAGLLAIFGLVTPLLYLMKNLLVCLAFIYFNFMTKLRIFNTQRMYL